MEAIYVRDVNILFVTWIVLKEIFIFRFKVFISKLTKIFFILKVWQRFYTLVCTNF